MRAGGILLHISSLPSTHGIGSMGADAYRFVDFLSASGMKYWQMLPMGPTGYGNSPYQPYSSFAGNPYFIDIDMLQKEGLLTPSEINKADIKGSKLDFDLLQKRRLPLLKKAAERVIKSPPKQFYKFCEKNSHWLDDYALFAAIKEDRNGEPLSNWGKGLIIRDKTAISKCENRLALKISQQKAIQYLFFDQWDKLKKYANEKGIGIIGDIPIYVSPDSADVWTLPELFAVDENLCPTQMAGCPPDSYSKDGQLWGNPVYNWDKNKEDNFSWWRARLKAMCSMYDGLRIDHFRGFAGYYSIPAGSKTAAEGEWKEGPGISLFKSAKKEIGRCFIIAEDLGFITDDVRKLLKDCGFAGMKVLQFGFDTDEDSEHLPHNWPKHCVAYTGTHDNDTFCGWLSSADHDQVRFAKRYLRLNMREGYAEGAIKAVMASPAELVIIPMQDILGLGSASRMNTPSTVGNNNWTWRLHGGETGDRLARKIKRYLTDYRRTGERKE